jgi:pimeloyl-ACP methyl ester carboxylesterase
MEPLAQNSNAVPTARLIVAPGLSSPHHPDYIAYYEPLLFASRERGYEPMIVQYPGHMDVRGMTKGDFSPAGAQSALKAAIENGGDAPVRIIGISFGCVTALAAANELKLPNIERVVLWGPSPYWCSQRAFVHGYGIEHLGKGAHVKSWHSFFQQLEPLEVLLSDVKYPCRIAAGSLDRYCPAEYLQYLRATTERMDGNYIKVTAPVPECEHNVLSSEPGYPNYLDILMG